MRANLARPAVAGGIAGFIFLALSSGVIGADVAHARAAKPLADGVCATRPKAAATTSAHVTAFLAAPGDSTTPAPSTSSPSTSPPDPASSTPAPSMSAMASPSDPPSSDPPSADPTDSSAAPDPSGTGFTPVPPGSGPSGSTSPSPSPSSSSPAPSQLCVQVQSLSGASQVQAGKSAAFVVWVWSVGGPSQDVAVTASVASAKSIGGPAFTVCPQASGAVCDLGTLPAAQADELEVTSAVGKAATASEKVRLTAAAKGTGALPDSASLALSVTMSPVTTTSPPAGGLSLPVGAPVSLPPLPGLPIPGGVSGNPAGLFPTVAPAPTAGSGIGFPPARKRGSRGRLVTAAATVPLSPGLIGGQLAGLAVLAAAIAIAIARISLRRARPQDGPEDHRPAT
jgi:hypothetical protein